MCLEIPWSSSIQTATHKHTELILDALRCIKPVELRRYQLLQAAVNFRVSVTTQAAVFSTRFNLSVIAFGAPADVAVVDSSQRGVHQCYSRLHVECTPDMSKLTKMVELGHADLHNVFLEAEVG